MGSRFTALLALMPSIVACTKSTDGKREATAKQVEPTRLAPTTDPEPARPWTVDAPAVQAKLQGAWVLRNVAYLGSVEAWDVTGDQVKVWDHGKEQTYTLSVVAPCEYELKQTSNGNTSSQSGHFLLDGDTLHIGLGGAAVKQGEKIIGCMGDGIFVFDQGHCKKYQLWAKYVPPDDVTCSLDGTAFNTKDKAYGDASVTAHGNVFATDQLWSNAAPLKVARYDEAKAKAGAAR